MVTSVYFLLVETVMLQIAPFFQMGAFFLNNYVCQKKQHPSVGGVPKQYLITKSSIEIAPIGAPFLSECVTSYAQGAINLKEPVE